MSNILDIDPESASAFERVEYLMARLREPDTGCPWDLQQDFASIAAYTLEEAYEVVDAIEQRDMSQLKDELGDLLLQVMFHSQMAAEQGAFGFQDVADALVNKMLRRHPHVFPEGTLSSEIDPDRPAQRLHQEQVGSRWDEIKQQEQAAAGKPKPETALGGIPVGMTPLKRACKLQKKAAKVGFDWPDAKPVLDKMAEELDEIKQAVDTNATTAKLAEEVGDLLFASVNFLRHLDLDPEIVMKQANDKFAKRFQLMEAHLKQQGVDINSAELSVMEAAWQAIK